MGKGWIQILPNIFPKEIPVDYHHIDGKIFVSPMPSKLHKKVPGNKTESHIEHANDWIEFYYGLDPLSILQEDFFQNNEVKGSEVNGEQQQR
jgi:hypothetical protein